MDEVIEAITSGSVEGAFASFDMRIGGTIEFPKKTRKFFEFGFGFTIGGFIFVEFCK